MPSAGFESVIPAKKRPLNHVLDRTATESSMLSSYLMMTSKFLLKSDNIVMDGHTNKVYGHTEHFNAWKCRQAGKQVVGWLGGWLVGSRWTRFHETYHHHHLQDRNKDSMSSSELS